MTEFDLNKRYTIFIRLLNSQLSRLFEEQREFIKCDKGCAFCCKKGEYPFSRLEFEYLLDGFKKLSRSQKNLILSNIRLLNDQRNTSSEGQFMYSCPFLIDDICSVYENRGIICRTFGLLCEHDDGKYTLPFCHEIGLNYSSVYDDESGTIVDKKNGKKLCETEPKAYRIARDNIMNLSMANNLNLDWGESKTLLDYINEYDLSEL